MRRIRQAFGPGDAQIGASPKLQCCCENQRLVPIKGRLHVDYVSAHLRRNCRWELVEPILGARPAMLKRRQLPTECRLIVDDAGWATNIESVGGSSPPVAGRTRPRATASSGKGFLVPRGLSLLFRTELGCSGSALGLQHILLADLVQFETSGGIPTKHQQIADVIRVLRAMLRDVGSV